MNNEKFVEVIEHSMKSGFISLLILLALEKESANGYKLMKKISEDTFGEWRPSNSTIYPYLSNLSTKGLIEYDIKKTGQRESKEYSLTKKGREVLKMLVEKQQEMNLSLLSMITTVLDVDDNSILLKDFLTQSLPYQILSDKSHEEKIEILNKRIKVLSFISEIVKNSKAGMEEELERLKSK
ncbi:MAG: PadR family transcriptional regulator [Promethearchaeota archaeon]